MKILATTIYAISLGMSTIVLAQSNNMQIEWSAGPTGSKQWILSITSNNVMLLQTYLHYEHEDSSEHTIRTNILAECSLSPIQFSTLSSNIFSSGIYAAKDHIYGVPNLLLNSISRDGAIIGGYRPLWGGFQISFTDGTTRKMLISGYANEYLTLCKALGMIDPAIKREIATAVEWLVGEVTRVAETDPGPLQTDETYNLPEQAGPGYPPQGVGSPDP